MMILPSRAIEDYNKLKEELACRSYAEVAVKHYPNIIREGNTGTRAYFDMNYRSLAVTIMETENGMCEINTHAIEYYDE